MINCEYPFYMGIDIKGMAGQNLLRLLKSANISQNKLAELLDVQPPYVNAIIKGKRGIGNKIMPLLCDILNVQPYEFYIDTNTPIVSDAGELAILRDIRESPEIKAQIINIADALAGHIRRDDKSSKGSITVQAAPQKAPARRRTA